MNKSKARKIAYSNITVGQIREVLVKARNSGAANSFRSKINGSFSKGAVFNLFWRSIEDLSDDKILDSPGLCVLATNILREFGEFWPK